MNLHNVAAHVNVDSRKITPEMPPDILEMRAAEQREGGQALAEQYCAATAREAGRGWPLFRPEDSHDERAEPEGRPGPGAWSDLGALLMKL